MPPAVPAATFILGILVSFALGYSVAVARRAISDFLKVKRSVKPMRRAAWSAVGVASVRGGIVTAMALAAIYLGLTR